MAKWEHSPCLIYIYVLLHANIFKDGIKHVSFQKICINEHIWFKDIENLYGCFMNLFWFCQRNFKKKNVYGFACFLLVLKPLRKK